jgi:arylformamidase
MIYDITPEIGDGLAVWPGDTPPSRTVLRDRERGDSLTLSTLTTTVHAGAHADAPSHCVPGGPSIDAVPLEPFIGPCTVVRVDAAEGGRLIPEQLPAEIESDRVLFATGTYTAPYRFPGEFAHLGTELVEVMHGKGIWLVGIDTPSIDPFDSRDLPAHHACFRRGISVLEGLVLDGVPEGEYELIALPLRLQGFDASPVRAILRTPD